MDKFLMALNAQQQVMDTPKAVEDMLKIRMKAEHHIKGLNELMNAFERLIADYGPDADQPQFDEDDMAAINTVKGYFLDGGQSMLNHDTAQSDPVFTYQGLKHMVAVLEQA